MNTIDALYLVKYNPFKYGEYLAVFYHKLVGVEQNLLLAPLLIPLFTHPFLKEKIRNSKKTSSLHTIFFQNNKELYDLQERIDVLRELTSESMQYCLLNQWLTINSDTLSFYPSSNIDVIGKIQVAEKLAQLFSSHSIREIYTSLGVKP